MARALSNGNLLSSLSGAFALLSSRRGFSMAAAAAMGRERFVVAEQMVKRAAGPAEQSEAGGSWLPDPATGYYRPTNRVGEIDPADLRAMLLSRNK